jgi:hypothetical protein
MQKKEQGKFSQIQLLTKYKIKMFNQLSIFWLHTRILLINLVIFTSFFKPLKPTYFQMIIFSFW